MNKILNISNAMHPVRYFGDKSKILQTFEDNDKSMKTKLTKLKRNYISCIETNE